MFWYLNLGQCQRQLNSYCKRLQTINILQVSHEYIGLNHKSSIFPSVAKIHLSTWNTAYQRCILFRKGQTIPNLETVQPVGPTWPLRRGFAFINPCSKLGITTGKPLLDETGYLLNSTIIIPMLEGVDTSTVFFSNFQNPFSCQQRRVPSRHLPMECLRLWGPIRTQKHINHEGVRDLKGHPHGGTILRASKLAELQP